MSIAQQIDEKENTVTNYLQQLDNLDLRLRKSELTETQRDDFEKEMQNIKKELAKIEKSLWMLRRENRRNLIVSLCLISIIALIYYWFWR